MTADDPRPAGEAKCPVNRTVYGATGTYYCDSEVWGFCLPPVLRRPPRRRDRGAAVSGREKVTRRFVPPLGWPLKFRAVTVTPGNRHPLFVWNRYPGQIIGFVVRLPDSDDPHPQCRNRALSILWAKPARWWSR